MSFNIYIYKLTQNFNFLYIFFISFFYFILLLVHLLIKKCIYKVKYILLYKKNSYILILHIYIIVKIYNINIYLYIFYYRL